MKNTVRKADCEYADTCVYRCKDNCKYYRKKKKFPPCPYVKADDDFSADQIKTIRILVAKFGSITSLMTLGALALVVFTVLSSGLQLFLADQPMLVLIISAAIGILIVVLCGLAVIYYIKIQMTVKHFRSQNKNGTAVPTPVESSDNNSETEKTTKIAKKTSAKKKVEQTEPQAADNDVEPAK